jgi:hypothetical protein
MSKELAFLERSKSFFVRGGIQHAGRIYLKYYQKKQFYIGETWPEYQNAFPIKQSKIYF